MSRRHTKITAENRTKTIKEWHFETGLSISTIESRHKRNQSGLATYTAEEIVGLAKIKQQYHKPDHRISPKPSANRAKEKDEFQIRKKFSKGSLL